MNRSDFIAKFAEEYNISQTKSKTICDSVFDFLGKTLIEDDKLYICGLGTFNHKVFKGHKIGKLEYGIDQFPDKYKIKFEPAPQIRKALSEKYRQD